MSDPAKESARGGGKARAQGREAAHDVLAAEMYAMPAPDPTIHHQPVMLPGDLTGVEEPRDVLAAEEFAMPAPTHHAAEATPRAGGLARAGARGRAAVVWSRPALAALGAVVLLRALRRR